MTYTDIVKQGIGVANRNLAVILTQFIAGIMLLFIFGFFLVTLIFLGIGSFSGLDLQALSGQMLPDLLQTSFKLLVAGALFGLIFLVLAALITAYVHAGNLGCVIATVKEKVNGFKTDTFFASGRRYMLSMVGLYVIWGLVALGGFFVLGAVGGVGFDAVLIPLKDAGRGLLAFGLGVPFIILLILSGLLFLFFLYAGWAFSGIILVGEEKFAFSAISSAYEFIKKNFWDSLLFAMFMFLLLFIANLITNSFFGYLKGSDLTAALSLFPLLFISLLLQMYIGLVARSSFVVYYVNRTYAPATATPTTPAPPVTDDEPLDAELHEDEGVAPKEDPDELSEDHPRP